jgi:insertion element IS1 protein InsB
LAKKKARKLPPLSETLVDPDAKDPEATTMEIDELWSFVDNKGNKIWIWIALCRKTRQIVARAVGDRSEKTCRELWNNVPKEYRKGQCFTDFWQAYQLVIPEDQLTQVGKETGETAHIERWNCTLRQRVGRFVRKTLSFSKSILMHIVCLDLFLHRYNLERVTLLA